MKRKMELIRDLLLLIEEQGNDLGRWIEDILVEGNTEAEVNHHIWLLADSGLIKFIDLSTSDGQCFRPYCLTWQGHEFLDDIRSQDVWKATLELARKGGSESLSAVWQISKSILQKRLEKHLGLA